MAKILDTSTGEVADVPDEVAAQATSSGRFTDVSGGRVQVVDKAGLRGDIDAADLPHARAAGYQVLTGQQLEEERLQREYGDRPIAAGVAGAARGATLGLSDLALAGTGAVDKETLRELRKRNEGASTVGEFAGALAPVVLSGGTAAPAAGAARVGTAVGELVAGAGERALLREAVGGAVEGGLQGLGEIVTEQSLEKDPQLTGQKVLASVGGGALLGFVGGAGFGAWEDKKAARAVLGEATEHEAATVAERAQEEFGKAAVGKAEEGAAGALSSAAPAPIARKAGVHEVPLSELDDLSAAVDGKAGSADRLREQYAQGKTAVDLDPIRVGTDAGDSSNLKRTIADGNHRLAVAREQGASSIRVHFTDDEAAAQAFNRPRSEDNYPGARSPMDEPGKQRPTPEAPPAAGAEAGAGTTPPAGGPDVANPMGSPAAFDAAVSGVDKAAKGFRQEAEKAVQEKAGTIKRIWEALDLGPLTPEEFVLRDFDLKQKGIEKLRTKGGLDEKAARYLLEDERYGLAKTAEQKLALVDQKVGESGAQIGEAVKALDEKARGADKFSPAEFIRKAREELVSPLARGTVDQRRTARRLEQELRALRDSATVSKTETGQPILRRMGFGEVEDYKRALDESLKWDATTPNQVRDKLRQLRGMLNADQERRAAELGGRVGEDVLTGWKAAKEQYGAMVQFQDAAAKRLHDAKKGNRLFSLSDNLVGTASMLAGGLANPLSWPLALGGALVNKWGRERLPHVMALALYRMEKNPGDGMAARAFRRAILGTEEAGGGAAARAAAAAGGAAASAGRFGPYTPLLQQSARLGPEALWAVHSALASDGDYQESLRQGGIPLAGPGAGVKRAAQLGQVQRAMADADARVDKAVSALVSGTRAPVRAADLQRTKAQAAQVATLAQNPEALIEQLSRRTATLSSAAPDASLAMVTTAQKAVAYLAAKAPRAPTPALDVPLLHQPWKPTDLELQRFAGHVSGALNPLGVLEDMASGRVQREQVEALRTVYPQLFEDVKARIVARLSEAGTAGDYQRRLSYGQRLSLGNVLGVAVEPSARPDRLAATQALYAQAQPARPPPRPSGVPPKSVAGGFTESERLNNRS